MPGALRSIPPDESKPPERIVAVSRTISIGVACVLALPAACQRAPERGATTKSAVQSDGNRSPAPAAHPLDPLTTDEIRTAIQVARGDARFAGAAFPSAAVQDPPKADVLAWQPGRLLVRMARVQAMTDAGFYELVVDLGGRRIVSAIERRGAEPSITLSEVEGVAVVFANDEFKAGLRKRGITDLTRVFCAPFS